MVVQIVSVLLLQFEDEEGEKFFAMGQIPWATSADQLNVEMIVGGRGCRIMKKISGDALKPGVLLNAFFSDSSGLPVHGRNDVHTIAVNKSIKQMRAMSDDPTACVSSEVVRFPWEANRKFDEFLIREVFLNGRNEVWMYLRVKRIGNLYEPSPETPSIPARSGQRFQTSRSPMSTASDRMDTSESPTKRARDTGAQATNPTQGTPIGSNQGASTVSNSPGVTFSDQDPLAHPVNNANGASNTAMVHQQVSLAEVLAFMKKMEANQQQIVTEVQKQKSENEGFQTAVAEKFQRVNLNAATLDLLNRLDPRNTSIPHQPPPMQLPAGQSLQIGYQGYGPIQQEGEEDDAL